MSKNTMGVRMASIGCKAVRKHSRREFDSRYVHQTNKGEKGSSPVSTTLLTSLIT